MPIEWNQLSGATQAIIARAAIEEVSIAIAEDAQLFAGTVRQIGGNLSIEDALLAFAARVRLTAKDAKAVPVISATNNVMKAATATTDQAGA